MPRRQAPKKEMWSEAGRAASYPADWPYAEGAPCSIEKMANAGFYWIGPSWDSTSCHMCRKDLDGWEEEDDPMKEHERHSAGCPFVNLHLETNRLKTFKFWPHKSKKFTAKAKDFARAGLVHRPTPEEPDTVQCFTCGKWLAGWEPLDDPLEEHKMHLPLGGCTFITSLGADKENAVAPSAQEVPLPAVVPEAAAEGAAPLDPSAASSPPSVPAASVPAPAATNVPTPLAALSIHKSNGNDEDVLDGTTVEGHFKHQSDVQCHRLVRACEAQKDAFQVKASEMRERLVARVEELEMLMTSQMDQ